MKSDSTSMVKKALPWTVGLERKSSESLQFAQRDLGSYLTHKDPCNPFYLLSLDVVTSRARAYRDILASHFKQPLHFHFAMKSNNHPRLLKALATEGFGVDVVSGGELMKALECGFRADELVFSGVAKSKAEIEYALKANAGQLNVESFPELQRITELAKKFGVKANIAVRINPEVEAKTHPYIATGFRENKFGVDIADFRQMSDWILKHQAQLDFQGLSLHIGSQLTDFGALEQALEKTLKLEDELEKQGLPTQSLDVGGGVGISYQGDESEDFEILNKYAQSLKRALGGYSKDLHFEPGRFWVARAGVLVSRVEYVKRTAHKNFLIISTGMNALMRPMLYQAHHRIETFPARSGNPEMFDVVGPVCESSDVLGKQRVFSSPQEGDFVLIGEAGAYGAVLSSEYNLLGDVPELIWEDQSSSRV